MNAWKVWLHPKRGAREIDRLAAELEESRRNETAAREEAGQERRNGESVGKLRDAMERDLESARREIRDLKERLAAAGVENDSLNAELEALRKEEMRKEELRKEEIWKEELRKNELKICRRRGGDGAAAKDSGDYDEMLEAGESPFSIPTPRRGLRSAPAAPGDEFNWLKPLDGVE